MTYMSKCLRSSLHSCRFLAAGLGPPLITSAKSDDSMGDPVMSQGIVSKHYTQRKSYKTGMESYVTKVISKIMNAATVSVEAGVLPDGVPTS
jgi:hypothetical protein